MKNPAEVEIMDKKSRDFLVRLAWLYYKDGFTHGKIAKLEGISRVQVTRLLKKAVEKGIVRFEITDPLTSCLEKEDRLKQICKLKKAIVIPSPQKRENLRGELGKAGADYLNRMLSPNAILGVGWGTTLKEVLPNLAPKKVPNLKVVSLTGGLSANPKEPNPYDIASSIAKILDAQCHYLLVPAVVETPETREALLNERNVDETLELMKRADIALVGIGKIDPEANFFKNFPDGKEVAKRIKAEGGVGDVVSQPYNIEGEPVYEEFNKRLFTIGLSKLKEISLVIGIAGGDDKVEAIIGALKGEYINVLITDENTASKVLDRFDSRS